jgi:hypothetical protein
MLAQASINVPSTEKCSLERRWRTFFWLSTPARNFLGNVAIEQPITVLAERRGIPNRIVNRQAGKPAEQQIEIELFHQLAFRSHRIEGLQQKRPQQPLRRDRRSPIARVKVIEYRRQLRQRRLHKSPNLSQRMIHRNALLQAHIAEQTFCRSVLATHLQPCRKGINAMQRITQNTQREDTFSAAC